MVTHARRPSRGLAIAFTGMVATTLAVGGVIAYPHLRPAAHSSGSPVPSVSTVQASSSTTPSDSANPDASATPTASETSSAPQPDAKAAGPIGAPVKASAKQPINGAVLTKRIAALPRKQSGRNAWLVADYATGKLISGSNQNVMMLPASNMKTLTSVAVLALLGPDHQFTTSVVSPRPGSLVLVGGGDPTLACGKNPRRPDAASLATLAADTAKALKSQGTTTVTLGWDDSLFSGPSWNPTWPAGYSDQTTHVTALSCDQGMPLDATGKRVGPRTPTPSADAGAKFATLLTAHGIKVTGPITKAKRAGTEVAKVRSWPLHRQVNWTMLHSDNYAAEVLFRHVGLAGKQPGSFVGGSKALQAELTKLGIWQSGAVAADGSGLSRSNRASAAMLVKAWYVAGHDDHLATLLSAPPVAGATGTLADRFFIDQASGAGRGWVHAKTGTLTGVSTLSGYTTSASGQPLLVAMMVNDSTDDWWARVWIDQVASAATGCGC